MRQLCLEAGGAMELKLENIRPILEHIRDFFADGFKPQPSVNVKFSGAKLTLEIFIDVDDNIVVNFPNQKPKVDVHYIVDIRNNPINAIIISNKEMQVDVPGLPNPKFPIIS